jgi:hypothetical protein
MRQSVRGALIVSGLMMAAGASYAKPEYAKKEMKMCGHCHINPNGGGDRNERGKYYAMHDHTFKGLAPMYKSLWKMEIAQAATRLGLGDVTGDKTARVVLVSADGKATVNKIGEEKITEEASLDLGKDGQKLVVGAYAKGKPAVLVVPGAVYFKDGDKYTKKAAADLADVTGHVRFTDATENIFFFAGGQPDVWAIDLAADKPLTTGRDMVPPDQGGGVYSEITIHPPTELMGALGVPEEAQKVSVMGLFDPRNEGKLYSWVTWAAKEGGWFIHVADGSAIGPAGGEFKALWKSNKLAGKILDVAVGTDPKGSKNSGLLVLTEGEGGKRSIEFLALD